MIIEAALTVQNIVSFIEWITPTLGVLWGGFKIWGWVKAIREKDLINIQDGVADLKISIESVKNEISAQTATLVTEFKEQRRDILTLLVPQTPVTVRRPRKAPARKK